MRRECRKNSKGQAALEFLMTYGWAFMVILVMIGALGYYGVLSPKKFIPSKCLFETTLACENYQLSSTDSVGSAKLKLKNSLPDQITITNVSYNNEKTNDYKKCGGIGDAIINPDSSNTMTCEFGESLPVGSKQKVKFKIHYYKGSDQSFPKIAHGEVFATVQQG